MTTDFAAARLHLQRTYDYLLGDDLLSRSMRNSLDLLLEAAADGEFARNRATMVSFEKKKRLRQRRSSQL